MENASLILSQISRKPKNTSHEHHMEFKGTPDNRHVGVWSQNHCMLAVLLMDFRIIWFRLN